MNNRLGVSTGIFYKYHKEDQVNEMIEHLLNTEADIIEILFARPFMLDIEIRPDLIERLKHKSIALHAPFFEDVGYVDIIFTPELIDKVAAKARQLHASHIVIHPDLVPSFDLLKGKGVTFAFENLKRKRNFSLQQLGEAVRSDPSFRISLDIGHARDWGEEEVGKLLREFKDRIVEIQFSVEDNYDSFLAENENTQYDEIMQLPYPIILESRPKDISTLPLILKNIRTYFKE